MTNEFALAQLRHLYVQMASDGNNISNQSAARGLLAPVIAHFEASMTPYVPLPAAPPAPEGVTTGSCDAPEIGPDACTCRACLMNQVRRLRAEGAALEQPGLDDLPAPPDTAEIRPLVPSPAASLASTCPRCGEPLPCSAMRAAMDAIHHASSAASAPAAPEPPPCRTCGEDRDSQVHIMEHIYRPVKGARDGR